MIKTKFIVIRGMTGYVIPYLLHDLENKDNIILRKGNILLENKFLSTLYKIHNSKRINSIINLPFKKFWTCKSLSFIENYKFDKDTEYYIIILNLAISTINIERITRLKKDNVKYVLAFFDPISDKFSSGLAFKYRNYFDLVITFDQEDSKKYGFQHFFQRYSIFSLHMKKIENDIYFIGHAKNRENTLDEIARILLKKEIKFEFKICYGSEKYSRLHYIKSSVPYIDILNDIEKSKCILEIVQKGQSGATARYAEAVCYNKILITNNKNIINFPFYNPNYMHIFDNPSDIDINWIKYEDVVNYGYDGTFSPLKWLEDIEKVFKE